jgi:ABC-type dipeptide/oligopeptide/nickel transport system permease subunit
VGLAIISIYVVLAIFAPLIAPYNPYEPDVKAVLSGPTGEHLLGTDPIGRDTFSRIVYGARTSLMIGVIVVALAATIGMALGMIAGYFGGVINVVIMRLIDVLMSFPMVLLAFFIAGLLGEGLRNVIIALTVGLVPIYARLMCGQVLSLKENDYVLAGRAIGARSIRIMWRHLLPNSFPTLIVVMTMMLGVTVLAEAMLGFLGVGIEPPTAAWGSMVNEGRQYLLTHPALSFAPGLAIMLMVFGFNMVGDGLRDALDPRLRGLI